MTEKEQIQNQIQELQEKLKELEEQEPEMLLLRQGKVDFVGYKKKAYLRIEYTDSLSGVYKWYKREITFGDGLRFTLILDHSQFYYLLEELYQKEVVKQKEEVSSTKSPTLYDICVDWKNANINPPVSDLIDAVEKWLPKPQSANSQNAYVESAVEGFNDCLQQIKSKLR